MVREFSSGDTITAQRLNCYVRAIDNLCQRVRALQGGRATANLGRVYHPRVSWGDGYAYIHRVPLNLRQFEYVNLQFCKTSEYVGVSELVVLCGLVVRTSGTGNRTTVKTLAVTELFTPLFMEGQKIGLRDCMEGEGTHYVPECVAVLAEKDGGRRWEFCKKQICQMPSYFNGSYLRSHPYDFHGQGSYAQLPSTTGNTGLHARVVDCRWAVAGRVTGCSPCFCVDRCVHCVCVNFILPQCTGSYFIAYAGYMCEGVHYGMNCAYLWTGTGETLCLPMCGSAVLNTGRGGVCMAFDANCAMAVTFPEPEGSYVQTWKNSIYPLGYGYYSANHRRPVVRPFAPVLSKPEWGIEYYSQSYSPPPLPTQSREGFTICWQTYTCATARDPLCNCKVEYVTQQDVYLSRSGFAPEALFKPYMGGSE